LLGLALLPGCGKDSGSSWSRALPLGSYDLSAPVCGSTNEAPLYPQINHRVALFDFDDLTEHTLTVANREVTEVWKTKDCAVTATRSIFQNYDGVFSTRHDRRFTFDPPGCTLTATVQTTTFRVGPEFSDLLKDSADRTEELPFQVQTDDDHIYVMTSRDLPDLNELWGSYGCSRPDRLRIQANARPVMTSNSPP
jgi:hypothetical protein